MQRKREHLWVGLVLAAAVLAGFLLLVASKRTEARAQVALERRALERLHAIEDAQHRFHEQHGRYAWAGALRAAELIEDDVDADGSITMDGYRFDILLPHGLSPNVFVEMAPQAAGKTNPRLEAKHFAVLARPARDVATGRRSYYVDETRQLYVNEGVAEVAGGRPPPPPSMHLSQSKLLELAGRRWWPSEIVDPNVPSGWR